MKLTMVDDDGNLVVSKDIPDPVEVEIPLMSIRDYFAAAALTGLMANTSACLGTMEGAKESGISEGAGTAHMAYYFADAMLKVRNT